MSDATDYGPGHAGQRWFRILFDGDEKKLVQEKVQETRFLMHMEFHDLREVILEDLQIDEREKAALKGA